MSGSEEPKKVYTLDELEQHNTLKSLWIVIHNKVYDLTEFVDDHPGGEEVLLEQAGQVSTEAFEDVGHSEDARDLMKDFYIGDLCKGDKEPLYEQCHGSAEQGRTTSVLSWFIPTAISVGIIAVAVYKMMSS